MAFVGILFLSFNLRTAAVAFSPIINHIEADILLNGVRIGIIAAIPAVAFAFSAFFGAALATQLGLERLVALSIVCMLFGHVIRAVSGTFPLLFLGTVVSLGAAGIGNVLLPPIVKRYFPDRIGLVTALYALLLAVSAALPAALAAPVADVAGWQTSIGMWSVLALMSLMPWIVVLAQKRREYKSTTLQEVAVLVAPDAGRLGKIWHSSMAWALAFVFALSAAHFYTAAAWLPKLMTDIAGVDHVQAGSLLALFSLMGVPTALIVPILAARMKNISWLVIAGLAFSICGYLGLMLVPAETPHLWSVLIGLGTLIFPVSLVLINLHARTQLGSIALSGFVQGFGYAIAAIVPLLVGILHDVSKGWTVPMLMMLVLTVACAIPALALRTRKYIEDEMDMLK